MIGIGELKEVLRKTKKVLSRYKENQVKLLLEKAELEKRLGEANKRIQALEGKA